MALRGKCRHCGNPIGKEPLILEIANATLFVLFALRFGADPVLAPAAARIERQSCQSADAEQDREGAKKGAAGPLELCIYSVQPPRLVRRIKTGVQMVGWLMGLEPIRQGATGV